MDQSALKSSFLKEACERGFLHQCSNLAGLDEKMAQGPVVAYTGFDPTSDSLHVGHLLPVMLLRLLQKHGHKSIVLMGGGTAMVGDPSGKDKSRPILTDDFIDQNIQDIIPIFANYLRFGDGANEAVLVNNRTWLQKLGYLEFLRQYGHHFTINRMLTFDSVRLRLEREQPLTFLEFNYMLLQAYDFYILYKENNCIVQMAGSDQWGNIINGIELTRRLCSTEVYGFTTPLLTTSNGQKMGKTANGAVWLKEDKLSNFDFWQFWRNVQDEDVGRFLKLFTDLPMARIHELTQLSGSKINDAKKCLADEVLKIARGQDSIIQVHKAVDSVFAGTSSALEGLPVVEIKLDNSQYCILDALMNSGFAKSRSDARRLIRAGGVRMNDCVIAEDHVLTISDFTDNKLQLSCGKKRHVIIRISAL